MKSTALLICLAVGLACLPLAGSKSDEQGTDTSPPKPDASDKFIGKAAGQVRDDNGLKMKFVWCPAGLFKMEYVEVVPEPSAKKEGTVEDKLSDVDDVVVEDVVVDVDPKDVPARRRMTKVTPAKVVLTQGYWLGKYEVTQNEWKRVMQSEPWKDKGLTKEGDDYPATWVSWDDCADFCLKLTNQERQASRLSNDWEYTLPTEAQWERACRALSQTRFSFGNDESKLGDYGWFFDNARIGDEPYAPRRVGERLPNRWGLFDMHGNVSEFCRDFYTDRLLGGRDPEVTKGGPERVIRGGNMSSVAVQCQSAARVRHRGFPTLRSACDGFRVALSAVPQAKPAEPGPEAKSTIDK